VQWFVYAFAAVGVVVVLRRGSRPHDDTPDGALATA